jgi:DNA-binding CsgD family transcriptional regulator
MTGREAAVAALLARGASNSKIASELRISPHTARHHTENVLAKLNVHARAEVARAIVAGFRRSDPSGSRRSLREVAGGSRVARVESGTPTLHCEGAASRSVVAGSGHTCVRAPRRFGRHPRHRRPNGHVWIVRANGTECSRYSALGRIRRVPRHRR